jgi:acylphosphatase
MAAYGGVVTDEMGTDGGTRDGTAGDDAESGATDDTGTVRVTMFVRGAVQGVGFRWWTRARALELGLQGHARNISDGRVEVVAQGGRTAVARLEKLLREDPTTTGRPGRVVSVVVQPGGRPRDGISGFVER